MTKVRCKDHNQIVAERIEPCAEYPFGAVRLVGKHYKQECVTVIPLAPATSQPRSQADRTSHLSS